MDKTISTDVRASNMQEVVSLLAVARARPELLSRGLPLEKLARPLGRGERPFARDLAHPRRCEARSSEGIYLALLARQPAFLDIHPACKFGRPLRYDLLLVSDLLACFKIRRLLMLRVLRELKPAQWTRTLRQVGKQHLQSVYLRARSIALHELENVSALERKLPSRRMEFA
jgi:hypothetical protein